MARTGGGWCSFERGSTLFVAVSIALSTMLLSIQIGSSFKIGNAFERRKDPFPGEERGLEESVGNQED